MFSFAEEQNKICETLYINEEAPAVERSTDVF